MMTLSIGNKRTATLSPTDNRAFTFIEVMLTLVFLSSGLVLIFAAFFQSMDTMQHIACRAQANNLLQNKIAEMERNLRDHRQMILGQNNEETILVNNRAVHFFFETNIQNLGDLENIYAVSLAVKWSEGERQRRLERHLYLSG